MVKKNKYIEDFNKISVVKMGKHSSWSWKNDPKHLIFSLSRYKFVSKMFQGLNQVLEIGAGDGFKSKIVAQNVKKLTLCDSENINLKMYNSSDNNYSKLKYIKHDFIKKSLKSKYDGIYLLDVLEHISKKSEVKFIKNISKSLKKNSVFIIGIPSLESQKYASKHVKKTHVNCKSKYELKLFMEKFFRNVFMFSMNDEVLHTGFEKMSNYIFALCVNKK